MEQKALSTRLVSVAPWTTLAACAGLSIVDVALSLVTPGYDIVAETSSQLMSPDAPYSPVARVVLGLYAVLLAPFGLLVIRSSELRSGWLQGAGSRLAVAGIWAHIVAALIGAVALNDSPDVLYGQVTVDRVHDLSARLMFAAGLMTVVGVGAGLRASTAVVGLTLAVLMVLLGMGSAFVLETWTAGNGVLERVLALSFMTWMVVMAWTGLADDGRFSSP